MIALKAIPNTLIFRSYLFSTRERRLPFLVGNVACNISLAICHALGEELLTIETDLSFTALVLFAIIIWIIMSQLALAFRRAHDSNLSGAWILIPIVLAILVDPILWLIVSLTITLVLLVRPTHDRANTWGPVPSHQ